MLSCTKNGCWQYKNSSYGHRPLRWSMLRGRIHTKLQWIINLILHFFFWAILYLCRQVLECIILWLSATSQILGIRCAIFFTNGPNTVYCHVWCHILSYNNKSYCKALSYIASYLADYSLIPTPYIKYCMHPPFNFNVHFYGRLWTKCRLRWVSVWALCDYHLQSIS